MKGLINKNQSIGSAHPMDSKLDKILKVLRKKKLRRKSKNVSIMPQFKNKHHHSVDNINQSKSMINDELTRTDDSDDKNSLPLIRRLLPNIRSSFIFEDSYEYNQFQSVPIYNLNSKLVSLPKGKIQIRQSKGSLSHAKNSPKIFKLNNKTKLRFLQPKQTLSLKVKFSMTLELGLTEREDRGMSQIEFKSFSKRKIDISFETDSQTEFQLCQKVQEC